MSDPNADTEPLSNLSDCSFVILGKGSLPSEVNDDINREENLTLQSKSQSPFSVFESASSTSDDKFLSKWSDGSIISESGIQKKLDELVRENYQLKETLSQNNLAIKSQLDTFFMWQQEVLKTHETHKEKFLETKDLILKLRAENASLKKQLEESSMGAIAVNDTEIYAEVNKKPEELEKLKLKLREFEHRCNDLIGENNSLNLKNENLKEELKVAESEIFKLNKELEDLKRDNTYLQQKSIDFSKSSLGNTSHKSILNTEAHAQICNLLKQLDEEKAKVYELKEELKKIKSTGTKASDSNLTTTEELNQYIDKIDDVNVSLDKQNQRFSSLQSWVSLAEENIKENKISTGVGCNLIGEINELKTHLNREENLSKEKQESLQDLRKQFVRLLDDYKALQSNLSSINSTDTSLKQYKEEISALSAKLDEKDKELKLKEEDCDNLKETIKKLNLECEEVVILRIQAEQYETDFKEERSAREKLHGEKEELAERIRYLTRENENLKQNNMVRNSETANMESGENKNGRLCVYCLREVKGPTGYEEHCSECAMALFS